MKLTILLLPISICAACSVTVSETPDSKLEAESDKNDYYPNGNIRIERKALDNGDSLWIFRQEDGGCWEEDYYRKGEIYKKIIFNSDCSKSAEYEMKNGKRNGDWKSYHENGKLREEGQYKNGISVGKFNFYDETGTLSSTEFNIIDSLGYVTLNPGFALNFATFKENLEQLVRYQITEDIKVAGNDEYKFPIIKWDKNELYFHFQDGHDSTAYLMSFDISDPVLQSLFGVRMPTPGTPDYQLLKIFFYDIFSREGDFFDVITLHQLKLNKTVSCYIDPKTRDIYRVTYENIETRY